MRGFILGLTSGAFCLTACAPILVPYLLGEGKKIRADLGILCAFLVGRLIGYLAFGAVAWSAGALLHPVMSRFAMLIGATYLLLGVLMVVYGITKPRTLCAASVAGRVFRWRALAQPPFLPAILGLLTGLNLCPPFLIAFTEAANGRTLAGSLLFFLAFFLGTSVFFVPFPVFGALRRYPAVQTVGRMTAVIVGVIYCGLGLRMII